MTTALRVAMSRLFKAEAMPSMIKLNQGYWMHKIGKI